MNKPMLFAMLALTMSMAAPANAEIPNMARDMIGGGMKGKKLAKAIAEAEKHPLGSRENPVRENMPQGQRAYLSKLRCADDSAPGFTRAGNVGPGPYGSIVDLYMVTCKDQPAVEVYMDMYHDGGETRPVPGFTFAGSGA